MTAAEYWRVKQIPTFTDAKGQLFGQDVMFSDTTGFLHSIREIFSDEIYHFRAKRSSPYIVDAGANIGLSIIYFKRLYPDSRILAYEPDPHIFTLLEHNVSQLGYEDVTLKRSAAWVEDTELVFYSEGSLAGSAAVDFLEKSDTSVVKAERLKDVLSKEPVDFLKIDIEGSENEVLFDIEPELANVDHLFFEYHSIPAKSQKLGDMLNLVQRAGFRYVINGPHGPRLPFVDRCTRGFDLQLNVSCFRP